MSITPKQYAMANRLQRMRGNLPESSTVTEAVYNSGYEASSRLYETATKSLGMRPSVYRQGGRGMTIHYAIVQSYLGWVLIAATKQGICKIDFDNAPEKLLPRLQGDFPEAELAENDPGFTAIIAQVLTFLEAPQRGPVAAA